MAKSARNLFTTAAPVPPQPTKVKGGKQRLVKTMPAMNVYAAIRAIMKSLEGLCKAVEGDLKGQMLETFIEQGQALKRRPENFTGMASHGEGMCMLVLKGGRSQLTEDERATLEQHNIRYTSNEVVPQRYVFNPAYVDDQKLMERINAALLGVKGLPADIIQLQQPQMRHCACEESVQDVFQKIDDPDLQRTLLPLVSTLAIKAKLKDGQTVDDAVAILHEAGIPLNLTVKEE